MLKFKNKTITFIKKCVVAVFKYFLIIYLTLMHYVF